MVSLVNEIVERAANLRARQISKEMDRPSRADLLADRLEDTPERTTPEIRYRLMKAEGYEQLQREVANIRAAAMRSELELTLGDRIRLLLAQRSTSDWSGMVSFVKWMDAQVPKGQRLFTDIPEIGQQYAMALNRIGGSDNSILAEGVLSSIIAHHGGDSETLGILGRVYKDRWFKLRVVNWYNGYLFSALKVYWDGVDCSPRELYPAINVLTLLRIAGCEPETLIRFAEHIDSLIKARIESDDEEDYFNYATRVELYAAMGQFGSAWGIVREAASKAQAPWELETTARNLSLISTAGAGRGALAGTQELEQQLERSHVELEIMQKRGEWSRAGELGYLVIPQLERSLLQAVEANGLPAVVELVAFLRDHAQRKAPVARAVASAA
jgi:hypothetical protein